MRGLEGAICFAVGVAAALVALAVAGVEARADLPGNPALTDINFGYQPATRGTRIDFNTAELDLRGQEGPGTGSFATSRNDRSLLSWRVVDGTFSNQNDEGTKTVVVQWMMTEPDRYTRSSKRAALTQKKYPWIRIFLYTVNQSFVESGRLEDCSASAKATDRDENNQAESVKINLRCRGDALSVLGFTEDMIDMIEDTIRLRSLNYTWKATQAP